MSTAVASPSKAGWRFNSMSGNSAHDGEIIRGLVVLPQGDDGFEGSVGVTFEDGHKAWVRLEELTLVEQ